MSKVAAAYVAQPLEMELETETRGEEKHVQGGLICVREIAQVGPDSNIVVW
jgi:hypothetical protein